MRPFLQALLNRATPPPYVPDSRVNLPSAFAPTDDNKTAQLQAYSAVGDLFAIVSKLSTSVAQVNWHLYKKTAAPVKADEREEIFRHWALDLWNRPNKFFTQNEFIEVAQQHLDLAGESWWVIVKAANIPIGLWPVRPDRMYPVPSPTHYLAGYIYTDPNGKEIPLALDEVIFLRTPSPIDPYRGVGPVQSILTDLDATKYSAEWNRNFFLNSAEPGGIIQYDHNLNDDEFKTLTARWKEQHGGVAQAHRVAIIEAGQWVDRKYTNRDMQFTELRDVSRETIRNAFGFPKPMTGAVDDVNRANAEAASYIFSRWNLVPRLDRIRDALNYDFLPMFYGGGTPDVEFDYENPVDEDRNLAATELTARATAVAALVPLGFDAAETLAAVGLPEISFTKPEPVALPAPASGGQAPPNAGRGGGASSALADHDRYVMYGPHEDFIHKRLPRDQMVPELDSLPDLSGVRTDMELQLDLLESQFASVVNAQIRQIGESVEEIVTSGKIDLLSNMSVDTTEAEEVIRRHMGAMAQTAALRMARELADQGVFIDIPEVDEKVRAALGARIVNFGSEMIDIAALAAMLLSRDLVASAANEVLRRFRPGVEGASVADQVKAFLTNLSGKARRSRLGGMLHRATNLGRLAVAGVGLRVRPDNVVIVADERNDANTCAPCAAIDGRVFADLTEVATVYGTGGYVECDGRDRCRGTFRLQWITDGA